MQLGVVTSNYVVNSFDGSTGYRLKISQNDNSAISQKHVNIIVPNSARSFSSLLSTSPVFHALFTLHTPKWRKCELRERILQLKTAFWIPKRCCKIFREGCKLWSVKAYVNVLFLVEWVKFVPHTSWRQPRLVRGKDVAALRCWESLSQYWEMTLYFNSFLRQYWKFMSRICPAAKNWTSTLLLDKIISKCSNKIR